MHFDGDATDLCIALDQGCQTHFSSRAAWSKSILTRAGLQISFLKKSGSKNFFLF